jgi:molybdenum cofactor synthesis domain-containing protein
MASTAAALIIGNEILTGKVAEQNVYVLARELFALGVELKRVIVCSDDIAVIARDLNELRQSHDVVVTSGGVGPTHDDLTIKAVAAAFGVPVERAPLYESMLREYYGERVTDMHLRMADVPAGCKLVTTEEMRWPTIVMDNVYVMPGVPEIFKAKIGVLREQLKGTSRFFSRALYVTLDEPALALLLDELSAAHTDVSIGSYLRWGKDGEYRTKLTIDGRAQDAVERCFAAMVAGLSADVIVRHE